MSSPSKSPAIVRCRGKKQTDAKRGPPDVINGCNLVENYEHTRFSPLPETETQTGGQTGKKRPKRDNAGKKKRKHKTRRRERDTDGKHCVGEIQEMQRLAGMTKEAEGRENLWVKSNDKKAERDGEMDEEKKHKRG